MLQKHVIAFSDKSFSKSVGATQPAADSRCGRVAAAASAASGTPGGRARGAGHRLLGEGFLDASDHGVDAPPLQTQGRSFVSGRGVYRLLMPCGQALGVKAKGPLVNVEFDRRT